MFEPDSKLRNAHAHALFDRLTVVQKNKAEVARGFGAFTVEFGGNQLAIGETAQAAAGVSLMRKA